MDELSKAKRGGYTKASRFLLLSAWGIVLADILGVNILSGGYDLISGRLHDQLQVVAFLSVPLVFVLVSIGFILGLLDWRKAWKDSCRPSRMTVVMTILNLISVTAWITLVVILVVVVLPNSYIP